MKREPEIIEGQFEVGDRSAKAGAERVKKPGVILPTVMAVLSAVAAAQPQTQESEAAVRVIVMLALCFTWPFWRVIQLAIWSAQCKVSEADADRLAERFPTRAQRRSKA